MNLPLEHMEYLKKFLLWVIDNNKEDQDYFKTLYNQFTPFYMLASGFDAINDGNLTVIIPNDLAHDLSNLLRTKHDEYVFFVER